MTAIPQPAFARAFSTRFFVAATGAALAAGAALLVRHIAPLSPDVIAIGIAGLAGLPVIALAFLLEDHALPTLARSASLGTGLVLLGQIPETDEERLRLFGFAMVAMAALLATWLARSARGPARLSADAAALFGATLAALSAYSAYMVIASRDLMIADFMTYRSISIAVARLIDARELPLLVVATLESIARDYSWLPALAPGLALALTAPFSRAAYTFALLACYAAPAALALAILSRDIARRAGLPRDARPPTAILALGVMAAIAAYPAGIAVAGRGMPDIGGLVLFVCALRLSERLARLLELPGGHDARVARMTSRVAVALGLTFFAMFAFRRWYVFAAAGVAATLAVEVAFIWWRRRAGFRWRSAAIAAATGALILLGLASPLIVDWLPNLAAHDYASVYAAYRKTPEVFVGQLADWVGLLPATAACACAVFLLVRSTDRRLLRLTIGATAVATVFFLRIQTPYIHHLYLIAPGLIAPTAAALMAAFAKAPRAALAALVALGSVTLSPLAKALNPVGLAPIAGLPATPRPDLAELDRLRDWVDARARPDNRVCGLGSSYTFSGQLIGELWQLHPERKSLKSAPRTDVMMSDVDSVEGPPVPGLKDCAILIVGDPPQTHLNPAYQQTVIVPAREVLDGRGIGAKFRRSGEVFRLEKGVEAVVFERLFPLDDTDIQALQNRWRAARVAVGLGPSGSP